MTLTVRLFGLEILYLAADTDPPSPEPDDDCSRDLSGGTTTATPVDTGPTDRYMGFTSGLEDE